MLPEHCETTRLPWRGICSEAFWETMRTYCWIPAQCSSFGSNCPVQSIRRGQRRYLCEMERNEFLIYIWQLKQTGLISVGVFLFFFSPLFSLFFFLEDFKMNYKSEDLPRFSSLIKHITCIKKKIFFRPAAERLWNGRDVWFVGNTVFLLGFFSFHKRQHVNTFHKYKLCFLIKLLSLLYKELARQTKV